MSSIPHIVTRSAEDRYYDISWEGRDVLRPNDKIEQVLSVVITPSADEDDLKCVSTSFSGKVARVRLYKGVHDRKYLLVIKVKTAFEPVVQGEAYFTVSDPILE